VSKKLKLIAKFTSEDCKELNKKIASEVNAYIHMPVNDAAEDPLLFWKSHQHTFPNLSILAKYSLSISASSVPVEAIFSSTGLLLNVKRSSMAPYRTNILTVIHASSLSASHPKVGNMRIGDRGWAQLAAKCLYLHACKRRLDVYACFQLFRSSCVSLYGMVY